MAKVIVNVKRSMAQEIIMAQKGKFFTTVGISKDGSRNIITNCRTGVKKFLSGGKSTTEGHADIKTVFNVKKMQYRNVNLDGISEIRANGVVYKF